MSNLEDARGRKPIVSTGRGGAGNLIRSPSRGVDPEVTAGVERGREFTPRDTSGDRVTHSGRGGAGNIRSPSRNRADIIAEEKEAHLQDRLVAEARGRQADQPFSTGRGGVGNIRDKSRSRSAVRGATPSGASDGRSTPLSQGHVHHDVHSSGRGGWGNISEDRERDSVDEAKEVAERKYEAGVAAKHHADEANVPHSIGKGGAGNIGQVATPVDLSKLSLEEQDAFAKVHAHDRGHGISGGRGGAGNIHTPKEHSPAEGERGRGDQKHGHGGVLGSVFRSLSRAAGRDKSSDRKPDE
ncbi:hypothetical protein EHS25_008728 [Saitozyma podzolica]|uniref:Uncharacterized protein n=1 Tax=Saitozyma podzolica TaxID=1890683 RepID=A0A427YMK0_9TREE|nr:hypothetical protein EHS25_008728 [Saitozyma podzolica]